MATFKGTNLAEIITPGLVSPSVDSIGAAAPTSGDDVINAGGGNDVVAAGGGDDNVQLGSGNDRFIWLHGNGSDTLDGGIGFDTLTIRDGGGDDELVQSFDTDHATIVDGFALPPDQVDFKGFERLEIQPLGGSDTIALKDLAEAGLKQVSVDLAKTAGGTAGDGAADQVQIFATDAAEHITVTAVGSTVRIAGMGAAITVSHADAGKDLLALKGFGGDDRIDASGLPAGVILVAVSAGAGNDRVIGSAGRDDLSGDTGDDVLTGGRGADSLDGGDGVDTASYAGSAAGVFVNLINGTGKGGDANGDELKGIENLIGSSHNDVLVGAGSSNALNGGAGNDVLVGHGGGDRLIGGAGVDLVSYADASDAMVIDLGDHAARGADIGPADTLLQIENATGSSFADSISGDAGNNVLRGGNGDDSLFGNGGLDVLVGGAGADDFFFEGPLGPGNLSKIADFVHGVDTIVLRGFLAVGETLTPNELRIGTAATDADDRIIYNPATGALIFDSNGSGAGHAIEFAVLAPHLTLTVSDFLLNPV